MDKPIEPNAVQCETTLSAQQIVESVSSIAEYLWDCVSASLRGESVPGVTLSGATIKFIKTVMSIPDMLFMRKIERFCRGLQSLTKEESEKYVKNIEKLTSQREHVFLLNVLNKNEEEEKLDILASVFAACASGVLDHKSYRRLALMIESSMYDDLNFLIKRHGVGSVKLEDAEAIGLLSEGWLKYGGQTWGTCENEGTHVYDFTEMAALLYSCVKAPRETS